MNQQSKWISEILVAGLDDWVQGFEIVGVARRAEVVSDEALRAVWIGLVAELLAKNLVEPGQFDGASFVAWAVPMEEAIHRMILDIDRLHIGEIGLGDVVWLRLTDAGRAAGEAALATGEFDW